MHSQIFPTRIESRYSALQADSLLSWIYQKQLTGSYGGSVSVFEGPSTFIYISFSLDEKLTESVVQVEGREMNRKQTPPD